MTRKNKRSVWSVTVKPYKEAHFATYPPDLIEPCILAGSEEGDTILDPFMGAGTTAAVAKSLGRYYLGCELNEDYGNLIQKRIQDYQPVKEVAQEPTINILRHYIISRNKLINLEYHFESQCLLSLLKKKQNI